MLRLELSQEVRLYIQAKKTEKLSIGFVPTMGALHEGHLSLIARARSENDIVVGSIYVNPLQFNNKDDFKAYPRLAEADCVMLEKAGCDMVFLPDDSIIRDDSTFKYNIGYLDTILEGHFRPGHFRGVAFIVRCLFEAVQPDRAYFGEKDYQQLAVVRKMNADFNLGVNIIPCPTLREADGLAMSSRNARLTPDERRFAPAIYNGLVYMKEHIQQTPFDMLKSQFVENLKATGPFDVEYVEICDAHSLEIIKTSENHKHIVICTAVFGESTPYR